MHLKFNNVNDAFRELVRGFDPENAQEGRLFIETDSRDGKVIQLVEPIIVTYKNPLQRVLFNSARDANPFLHVFESLWMLAGRNDVAKLAYYASDFANITSDDGETANGAYGYRWRNAVGKPNMGVGSHGMPCHVPAPGRLQESKENAGGDGATHRFGTDQLAVIIDHLKRKPESRRAVLAMWNVEDDLLKIDTSKDVCCNLSATFQLRKETWTTTGGFVPGPGAPEAGRYTDMYLDMTVFNRSNDLIWGMLGANVVHFSFLQEYVAHAIGARVGVYNQITTNLHVYTERAKFKDWVLDGFNGDSSYLLRQSATTPLVRNLEKFDAEVKTFVNHIVGESEGVYHYRDSDSWEEPFIATVALPMANAFWFHKLRKYDESRNAVAQIDSWDWREVCLNWIQKRERAYLAQK